MSQTYTGTAAYTNTITIPDDGDPAAAASVNNPTKSEADMSMFLLQSIGLMPQSTSAITLISTDGLSVNVGPISSIIVNEIGNYKTIGTAAASSIGVAQVEGAPAQFAPNTWYYIYVLSQLGVLTFTIRTVRPDVWNMFAQGNDIQRYIGSFKTNNDAVPHIVPFYMTRGYYTYLESPIAGGGNSLVESVIPTNSLIPPTSRIGRLIYYLFNIGAPANLTLIPSAGLAGYVIPSRGGPPGQETGYIEMFVNSSQNILYKVDNNNLTTFVAVNGYQE